MFSLGGKYEYTIFEWDRGTIRSREVFTSWKISSGEIWISGRSVTFRENLVGTILFCGDSSLGEALWSVGALVSLCLVALKCRSALRASSHVSLCLCFVVAPVVFWGFCCLDNLKQSNSILELSQKPRAGSLQIAPGWSQTFCSALQCRLAALQQQLTEGLAENHWRTMEGWICINQRQDASKSWASWVQKKYFNIPLILQKFSASTASPGICNRCNLVWPTQARILAIKIQAIPGWKAWYLQHPISFQIDNSVCAQLGPADVWCLFRLRSRWWARRRWCHGLMPCPWIPPILWCPTPPNLQLLGGWCYTSIPTSSTRVSNQIGALVLFDLY